MGKTPQKKLDANKRWRESNRGRHRALNQANRSQLPPAKKREYQNRNRYGIEPHQFDQLLMAQNGCCAICLRKLRIDGRRGKDSAAIDHDHETNAVRGIVCLGCNTGLDVFADDVDTLQRAIAYLELAAFRAAFEYAAWELPLPS